MASASDDGAAVSAWETSEGNSPAPAETGAVATGGTPREASPAPVATRGGAPGAAGDIAEQLNKFHRHLTPITVVPKLHIVRKNNTTVSPPAATTSLNGRQTVSSELRLGFAQARKARESASRSPSMASQEGGAALPKYEQVVAQRYKIDVPRSRSPVSQPASWPTPRKTEAIKTRAASIERNATPNSRRRGSVDGSEALTAASPAPATPLTPGGKRAVGAVGAPAVASGTSGRSRSPVAVRGRSRSPVGAAPPSKRPVPVPQDHRSRSPEPPSYAQLTAQQRVKRVSPAKPLTQIPSIQTVSLRLGAE